MRVLIVAMLVACASPPASDAAYERSTSDSRTFIIGPHGIGSDVDEIEAGDKLGETWIYVQIPSSVLDPKTVTSTMALNIDGIVFAHEFFGDDPTASTPTVGDFRIDFVTSPSSTSGTMEIDRGSVYFDVTYSGTSTVYGPALDVDFEITTGFPN
ncbi:MAG TPA: hypothetical protein VMJ10_35695 [Kofleriaceae bacterium]|nr:hypothetical protein [Kofleriaceae bacterium]